MKTDKTKNETNRKQSDAERAREEAAALQEKLEKSQGEVYRLKAKLENAQGEQESLRQELEKAQSGVSRIHADRDRVGKTVSYRLTAQNETPHPTILTHSPKTTIRCTGLLRGGKDQGGDGAHPGHVGQVAAAAREAAEFAGQGPERGRSSAG